MTYNNRRRRNGVRAQWGQAPLRPFANLNY